MSTSPQIQPTSRADWAIVGIFWILALGALVLAKAIAIPIATAVLMALVLSPVRRWLNHLGAPSPVAAFAILAGLGAVVFGLGVAISDTLTTHIGELDVVIENAVRKLETITGLVEPVVQASEQIDAIANEPGAEEVVVRRPSMLSILAQGTPQFFATLTLAVTLLFFLLASGEMFYEKLVQVMPTLKDKANALAIARSIERHLSSYLFTITLINAGLGVAVGLAMWALGMPYPVLFGIAAFILNYIPYLGALGGVGMTFIVALLEFETPGAAAVPAVTYWVLTSLEGQFMTPYLVGRRLKLNAVVVFLALAVWAWIWGFAGMVLSTPMLIGMKAFSDRIPQLSGLGTFLGKRNSVSEEDGLMLRRFIPDDEECQRRDALPAET